MDIIAQFKDRQIPKVIDPTVTAFAPLLKARKNFIREIPVKTFQYGPTDRHQLDIYYPLTPTFEKTPILFFIYGGGFNTGERNISPKSFGLVYACVGAFYARHYRLVPNVTFPGPAEDVRDAVRWVVKNPENLASDGSPSPDTNAIAVMGHSAGAAHIATMLFHPNILTKEDELRSKIFAAILESPPYDLSAMTTEWESTPVHLQYWGSLEAAKANDPLHLYRRLPKPVLESLPKMLMVEGEKEPEWLIDAGRLFHDEVRQRTGESLTRIIAKGHNHISLNWALCSGEGEDWAEEAVEWLNHLKTRNDL
ncbi:alpha/beta hydrolase domain-containing protein [Gymnopilus junonius]|uniref:Alpha/beta hydrolase domain-containing protein n=1 Tax=Gymnopilus junonius TaxID=109634 RepID=A0A9P5NUE8_GYMJU|nr:alpha/beta hydrolase domain-containing protein [Gymnopilus junonius]